MKHLSVLFTSFIIIFAFSFYQLSRKSNNISPGRQLTYKFKSEGIGYSDVARLYSNDTTSANQNFFRRKTLQMVKLNIQCDIKKTIVRESAEGSTAAFEIINPEILIETDGMPVNTEIIKSELTRPVITHLTNYGLIKNLRIDTSISYTTMNFIKNILSQIQFVIPDKKINEWKTEEENTSGMFLAKYKLLNDSAGILKYEKTNGGYIKMVSSQKNQKIIPDSRSEISIDSLAEISKIDLAGSEITLFGVDTIAASGSQVTIELLSAGFSTASNLKLLDDLDRSPNYTVTTTLSAGLSDDAITSMAYKNTLGDDSWESLINKLNMGKTQTQEEEEQMFLKFRAIAYLFPENCQKMAALLKTEPYNSFVYRILNRALTATGTTYSLNSIAEIIEARQTEEDLVIDFLPVIATSATPTDKVVDIVKRLAFETNNSNAISSTAQLALAGMAYNFKKVNKSKSDVITYLILNKMKTESDTLQKILVLSNIGSELAFPILKSFIYGNKVSTQMKLYAISALRLIESRETSSLLNDLTRSKDSLISKAAKETILFRKEYFEK